MHRKPLWAPLSHTGFEMSMIFAKVLCGLPFLKVETLPPARPCLFPAPLCTLGQPHIVMFPEGP